MTAALSPGTTTATASIAKPRRKSKLKWWVIGGTVLVAGLITLAVIKKRSANVGVLVTTEKAVVKTIVQTVTATGKVQPEVEVKINPEVYGEIIALPYREGAVVKKGDVIVKIKPDFYQAQVDQQTAAVAASRSAAVNSLVQLEKAEADLKKYQDLYDRKLVSDFDYVTYKTNYDGAKANRESALARLRKAQTSVGGFPWFPGGPPSPYMTLYFLHGFAKAAEFGVDVPKDMVQRAFAYVAEHYRTEWKRCMSRNGCWEFITFLNYVVSAYPDASWTNGAVTEAERVEMLDYSFSHWKEHSPYLKGYLALTLKRMGRPADAGLVWGSVMDSAKTNDEQGTFWAPEDRSWLWYNDTIETQAFALRTLLELDPKNAKTDGIVQWLLLNKKLNQWKSTRATAEVIYSLVHYLKREGALGIPEDATVTVGTQRVTFTFDPATYTGKNNRVVVPGDRIDPKTTSTIVVEKESKGFAFASAAWHYSTERLPAEDRGDFFSVSRKYFRRATNGRELVLTPLAEGAVLKPGDEIEVQLSLRTKHEAEYVHLRDPRAAGLEPENAVSRWKWDLGIAWYEEIRDSATNFFFERLPVGQYTFRYRLRANMAGTFRVGPAAVESMYAPEFNAFSAGSILVVAGD